MNSRYKYLIKNTGILTISNFSSKILVFFLVPLYTSVLSTAEYGTFDLAISTVQLLFPILTANIVDAVMRFAMDKDCEVTNIVAIAGRFLFGSFVGTGIILFINYYFRLWKDINNFEILIFLYYIFYVLNQFYIQLAKGLERIKDMGIGSVLGTVAMIVFNILFLCVFQIGLSGFFIANIFAQAIPVLYYSVRIQIWKYFSLRIDKTLERNMLTYSLPLILTTLGWWINSAADRYTVTFFCGIAANGLLSVAYKIPTILNTLQGIFVQAWQVSAIKEYGSEGVDEFYKGAFIYLNSLMCVGSAGLIFLTRPIAHILFANDFYAAWEYVPFLLLSSMFNAASGFIGPLLSARKDSKSMAMSAIYGAGTNVVLNIILVWMIGIQGATIATAISSFIIYYARRRATGKIIISDFHNKIILSWIILCIQAVIEVYFSNYIFSAICMFFVIFIYRKIIISFLKKVFGG